MAKGFTLKIESNFDELPFDHQTSLKQIWAKIEAKRIMAEIQKLPAEMQESVYERIKHELK